MRISPGCTTRHLVFYVVITAFFFLVWDIVITTKELHALPGNQDISSHPNLLQFRNASALSKAARQPLDRHRPSQFYLHIGPHKTATTSIQCALLSNKEQLRNKDSVIFLGKVDTTFCKGEQDKRIQQLDKCVQDENCWTKLVQEWEDFRRRGFDVILSKESISDWTSPNHSTIEFRESFWPAMEKALRGWNVTVVMSYRRYFEWLPSAFNQHAFHMRLQAREPWPEVGKPVGTLEEVLTNIMFHDAPPPYPYVDSLLRFDFPSSWNTQVLYMSASSDIVRDLLCDVVQAKTTCSNYQPLPTVRESRSEDLDYDYLNIQALHWGWMTEGRRGMRMRSTRSFVNNVLHHNHESWPRICPSRSILDAVLAKSLQYEKRFLGQGKEDEHRRDFRDSAQRFCSVNASAVLLLNERQWKEFYANL